MANGENVLKDNRTVVFALSRFDKGLRSQPYTAIAFRSDEILLIKSGKAVLKLPFSDAFSLTYHHFYHTLPRWMQGLSGNLFSRKEARFELFIGDDVYVLPLEIDIESRQDELLRVFADLYAAGVDFSEKDHLGLPLSYLKRVD